MKEHRAKLKGAALLSVSLLAAMSLTSPSYASSYIESPSNFTLEDPKKSVPLSQMPLGAGSITVIDKENGSPGGFKITPIKGVDLTSTAGWDKVKEIRLSNVIDREILGGSSTTVKTVNGEAVFNNLATGAYLVEGIGVQGAATQRTVATVPFFDWNTNAWTKDVIVYPKVSNVSITKEVLDGNYEPNVHAPTAGNVLTYRIKAGLPADGLRMFGGECVTPAGNVDFDVNGFCPSGSTYTMKETGGYIIRDVLPEDSRKYVSFLSENWGGSAVAYLIGSDGEQDLVKCDGSGNVCDYNVTLNKYSAELSLTSEGIVKAAKLRKTDPMASVKMDLQGIISREVVKDGTTISLKNTAFVFPGTQSIEKDEPVKSNEVRSIYAQLRIHKIDGKTNESLSGATFGLFDTKSDAANNTNKIATAVTDENGMAYFNGIHVNDYRNDGFTNSNYWLVEEGAPRGYIKSNKAFPVSVGADGKTEGADEMGGVPISNFKSGSVSNNSSKDNTNNNVVDKVKDFFTGSSSTTGGSSSKGGNINSGEVESESNTTGLVLGGLVTLGAVLMLLLWRKRRKSNEDDVE